LPRFAYRRPLLREFARFLLDFLLVAATRELLPERPEVLRADGEFMMASTEATCSADTPSLRPISSGEGTRFFTTNAAMETLSPILCLSASLRVIYRAFVERRADLTHLTTKLHSSGGSIIPCAYAPA
jgi:hypothetical protein